MQVKTFVNSDPKELDASVNFFLTALSKAHVQVIFIKSIAVDCGVATQVYFDNPPKEYTIKGIGFRYRKLRKKRKKSIEDRPES